MLDISRRTTTSKILSPLAVGLQLPRARRTGLAGTLTYTHPISLCLHLGIGCAQLQDPRQVKWILWIGAIQARAGIMSTVPQSAASSTRYLHLQVLHALLKLRVGADWYSTENVQAAMGEAKPWYISITTLINWSTIEIREGTLLSSSIF